MGRIINCRMALVSWGVRAKFRQGKLGLIRKNNIVYLALFFTRTEIYKLALEPKSVELLPAAIRFKDIQKDLFVQACESERYEEMVRGIKVLLRGDELRRGGKGDKLDEFIARLPQLNSIRLENPPLSSLQLSNCNLTTVPKQLEKLSRSLEYLDLSRNCIKKLPRTFCCKMNKMKYLNLSYNMMELLPLEIKFLSRLIQLNLSNNRLRLLPTTFSDLRRLRNLNVSCNNLSQLPAFKQDDIRLEVLDISANPLDGALQLSTFDGQLGYDSSSALAESHKSKVANLFEVALLRVVRDDHLFKAASEERLPATIVATIQRDIFKCYRCNQMDLQPAYNSTDYLEYVHVTNLIRDSNFSHGMTFMKLLCRNCFVIMGA